MMRPLLDGSTLGQRMRPYGAWVLTACSIVVFGIALVSWNRSHARRAAPIIAAIEIYRARTGQLPNPDDTALMTSLGFDLNIAYSPEFEALDERNYRLIYVEEFDCPYDTYDSRSRTWSDACD
jgi:hypothetical protein